MESSEQNSELANCDEILNVKYRDISQDDGIDADHEVVAVFDINSLEPNSELKIVFNDTGEEYFLRVDPQLDEGNVINDADSFHSKTQLSLETDDSAKGRIDDAVGEHGHLLQLATVAQSYKHAASVVDDAHEAIIPSTTAVSVIHATPSVCNKKLLKEELETVESYSVEVNLQSPNLVSDSNIKVDFSENKEEDLLCSVDLLKENISSVSTQQDENSDDKITQNNNLQSLLEKDEKSNVSENSSENLYTTENSNGSEYSISENLSMSENLNVSENLNLSGNLTMIENQFSTIPECMKIDSINEDPTATYQNLEKSDILDTTTELHAPSPEAERFLQKEGNFVQGIDEMMPEEAQDTNNLTNIENKISEIKNDMVAENNMDTAETVSSISSNIVCEDNTELENHGSDFVRKAREIMPEEGQESGLENEISTIENDKVVINNIDSEESVCSNRSNIASESSSDSEFPMTRTRRLIRKNKNLSFDNLELKHSDGDSVQKTSEIMSEESQNASIENEISTIENDKVIKSNIDTENSVSYSNSNIVGESSLNSEFPMRRTKRLLQMNKNLSHYNLELKNRDDDSVQKTGEIMSKESQDTSFENEILTIENDKVIKSNIDTEKSVSSSRCTIVSESSLQINEKIDTNLTNNDDDFVQETYEIMPMECQDTNNLNSREIQISTVENDKTAKNSFETKKSVHSERSSVVSERSSNSEFPMRRTRRLLQTNMNLLLKDTELENHDFDQETSKTISEESLDTSNLNIIENQISTVECAEFAKSNTDTEKSESSRRSSIVSESSSMSEFPKRKTRTLLRKNKYLPQDDTEVKNNNGDFAHETNEISMIEINKVAKSNIDSEEVSTSRSNAVSESRSNSDFPMSKKRRLLQKNKNLHQEGLKNDTLNTSNFEADIYSFNNLTENVEQEYSSMRGKRKNSKDLNSIEKTTVETMDISDSTITDVKSVEESLLEPPKKTYTDRKKKSILTTSEQSVQSEDPKVQLFVDTDSNRAFLAGSDDSLWQSEKSKCVEDTNTEDDNDFVSNVKCKVSITYKRSSVTNKKAHLNKSSPKENNTYQVEEGNGDIPKQSSCYHFDSSLQEYLSEEETSLKTTKVINHPRRSAHRDYPSKCSTEEFFNSSPSKLISKHRKRGTPQRYSPGSNGKRARKTTSWDQLLKSSKSKRKEIVEATAKRKLRDKVKKQYMTLAYPERYEIHSKKNSSKTNKSKHRIPNEDKKIAGIKSYVGEVCRNSISSVEISEFEYNCPNCSFGSNKANNLMNHLRHCTQRESKISYQVNDMDLRQSIRGKDIGESSRSWKYSNGNSMETDFPAYSNLNSVIQCLGMDDDDKFDQDDFSRKRYGFAEKDIVWAKVENRFWPSVLLKLTKRGAIVYPISCPFTEASVKISLKDVFSFNNTSLNKRLIDEANKLESADSFLKAVQVTNRFVAKKSMDECSIDPVKFFKIPRNTANIKEQSSDVCLMDENVDQPCLMEKGEEEDENDDKYVNVSEIMSYILDGNCDDYIISIQEGNVNSKRHNMFNTKDAKTLKKLTELSWFGPFKDDPSLQIKLFDYFQELFKSHFEQEKRMFSYVYEVVIPEAIIEAISVTMRLSRSDAEILFYKQEMLQFNMS